MNNWLYNGFQLPENIENEFAGFVYKITNIQNGKFYIGKKSFIHNKRKKLGKKELAALPTARGRKPKSKVTKVDSGWRNYWGSSKPLLEEIKQIGEDKFTKEILVLCSNKKQLTYYEFHYQAQYNVLFVDNSYNENIQGRFFRKDFDMSK